MKVKIEYPRKVVLLDAYCPSHVGNDVLLDSSLELIKRTFPQAEISVHARKRDSFSVTHGILCKQRLFSSPPSNTILKYMWYLWEILYIFLQLINAGTVRLPPYCLSIGARRETVKDYASADVAISIGGELISDTFWKVLPLHLHMFWLAKQSGARVVIFPQSIGPLKMVWTRFLARLVLSRCDILTGRDKPAIEELSSLGIKSSQILFSPDVGVGQPMASVESAREYLMRIGVDFGAADNWIGVTCSAGSPEVAVDGSTHIDILADSLLALRDSHDIGVVIMPANMPVMDTPDTDYKASQHLSRLLQDKMKCVLAPPDVIPARLFKAICGNLDVFVSTRMHAAILATMAPVPTITLNTQRKLGGFMELVGQQMLSIEMNCLDCKVLSDKLQLAIENTGSIKRALLEARSERLGALSHYGHQISTKLTSIRMESLP